VASIDLRALAARGAAVRVAELRAELGALFKAFPTLRKGNLDDPLTRHRLANTDDGTTLLLGRKRRKPMTAAQKRAVGIRMKAYWAKRKATKAR
jgi:hypothetical protein